jgi:hypothetical protein
MEQLKSQKNQQEAPSLNHFYHIYAGDEWLLTVHQHFVTLNAYGLMDSLENIYVGIIGKAENRQAVISHLESYGNPKIIIAVQAETGYEGTTLNKLWEFAKKDNGYIFYAHTKGSSRGGLVNQLWCRSMLFFNAVRWQDAVMQLGNNNTDAVGCHYVCKEKFPEYFEMYREHHPNKYPFFAGNFWWAKSSHIKDLRPPQIEDKYSAEGWLGSNGLLKNFDLFEGMPSLHLFQNVTF